MDYKLARKLKDSGFTQGRLPNNPFSLGYPDGQKWFEGYPFRPSEDERIKAGIDKDAIHIDDTDKKLEIGAYFPSLSELIAECGDRLALIGRHDGFWCAYDSWDLPEAISNSVTRSRTPEEATAKFLLAINKRKQS